MRLLYNNKLITNSFENDPVYILKNKIFAIDKGFYPCFTKIFFIKNGEKVYLDSKDETILDHSFKGDVNIEFLGDVITPEMLALFAAYPDRVIDDLEKSWDCDKQELDFILSRKLGGFAPSKDIIDMIDAKHDSAIKFMKKYDKDLQSIPQPSNLVKKQKIEHVKHEIILKNKQDFKRFINTRFMSGASEEMPLIIKSISRKGSKVKTLDVDLKKLVSKKDFVEQDSILFLFKNNPDRYLFGLNSCRLYVHSSKTNIKIPSVISEYYKEIKVIDIKYLIELNIIANVKKLPELIEKYYSSFFKQKETVRKGNSILLEYTRTSSKDIKVNIKNSKNGITTPVVIYNSNSYEHIPYAISILQSILIKSTKAKVAKNFFSMVDEEEEVPKQKKEANIKKLKEKGAKLNSVKCQKKRQPIINNERDVDAKTHELFYTGDRYVCNNSPYIFPGFTNDENVCCFKTDQRKKQNYNRLIGNTLLKLKVRASNFTVNGKRVIKMARDGDNYFYIDSYEPVNIIPIKDTGEINEIKKMERLGNMWLKEALMKNVLYTNSRDCKNSPKLENGKYVCKKVGGEQYRFGYTESSIPCCFKEERPVFAELKDTKDPFVFYDGSYIITSDKSIDKNRIGVLPDEVYYMLTKKNVNYKNTERNEYFRLGTKQNLEQVLKTLFNDFDLSGIASKKLFELSKSTEFKSLKELESYINSKNVDYTKIIDFISLYLKRNIIILDFEKDDLDRCSNIYSKNPKTLILIKNEGYYEILVSLKEGKKYSKNFGTKSDLVKNLKEYKKFKCNPITNKFVLKDLLKELKKDGVKVVSQILSRVSGKVMFVKTSDRMLLPIYPTRGIKRSLSIKYTDEIDVRISKKMFNLFYKKYSKYYSKIDIIQNGILLNRYLILPTKGTFTDITTDNLSYYKSMFKGETQDKRQKLIEKIEKQRDYYYALKYNFSKLITDKIKNDINDVVDDKNNSREQKFIVIKGIIKDLSGFSNSEAKYITQRLLGPYKNEILNKELPPKKIRMIKLEFDNYRNFYNWLNL